MSFARGFFLIVGGCSKTHREIVFRSYNITLVSTTVAHTTRERQEKHYVGSGVSANISTKRCATSLYLPCYIRCHSQVTRKGKSLSPKSSPRKGARGASAPAGGGATRKKITVTHDYFILRICPCPAETLKDLIAERKWMFRCRNMLLYITQRLREQNMVSETRTRRYKNKCREPLNSVRLMV